MKILLCLKEYNVKNSVDLEEREITESQKSFIINSVFDTIINEIQSSSHFFIYLLYAFKVLLPKEVPILLIEGYNIQGKHSWGKHTYHSFVFRNFYLAPPPDKSFPLHPITVIQVDKVDLF